MQFINTRYLPVLSVVTGEPSNAVIEFPKAVKDGFPIELSLAYFVSSTPLVLPIMVMSFFGDTNVILNEKVKD